MRCRKDKNSEDADVGSRSENAVLKAAWYGSEILGIAASFFRPVSGNSPRKEKTLSSEEFGGWNSRERVVEAIKEDFQRSYFVTGIWE